VLGVNESVFPRRLPFQRFWTETDRDELGHAVVLGQICANNLRASVITATSPAPGAREKLIVTFARNDADGRMLNPIAVHRPFATAVSKNLKSRNPPSTRTGTKPNMRTNSSSRWLKFK